MLVTITDEEVRQALVNYVTTAIEMQLESAAAVELVRVTNYTDGSLSADLEVTS